MDRRDFVKAGTAVAVGGVVTSAFPTPVRAAPATADAIRVGLIGCGGRGTGAAVQALSTVQDVKLVAMADAFRDKVDGCLQTLTAPEREEWLGGNIDLRPRIDVPEERRFSGFDAYKQVIPLVDVVILTTPPGFRPLHFEASVAADKQIFMEKPVATDGPGIRRVLAAAQLAKEKKLNVVVGLQRHYQTVYRKWVDRLHAGMIGDILLGRVYWNSGGVWVRPRQPGQTEMEYQMRNWYYFNWLCGDHIVEQHIHNIDVGNWVMNGHPVRAQGQGGRQVRTGKDHGEIFDHHFVEFEYPNGSRILSQCRHIPDTMSRVSEAFHGTNGTAPKPGLILSQTGQTLFEHDDAEDPNPYQVEHDELFAAVAAGEYKYADADRGAMATMTAIMGRMATYSGQVVTWDEAIGSDLDLMPETFSWDAKPRSLPDAEGRYPIPMPGVTRAF